MQILIEARPFAFFWATRSWWNADTDTVHQPAFRVRFGPYCWDRKGWRRVR